MITQTDVPYERMKELVRLNTVCAESGKILGLAWGGAFGISEHVLKCPDRTEGHVCHISRPVHISQYDIPGATLTHTSRRRQEAMEKEYGTEKMNKLAVYQNKGELSQQEVKDIVLTIWPGAPAAEVKKAALICAHYNLNPLMKHVFLIPFKGNYQVVLGIKATRIIAARQAPISYMDDTPRVMTEGEQKKIFGKVDGRLWAITRLRNERTNATAQGYGFWVGNEPYGCDKGNSAFNMAAIRSERAALDRLFPQAFPQDIEVADETAYNMENVDPNTGEIGEAVAEAADEVTKDEAEVEVEEAEVVEVEEDDAPTAEDQAEPEPKPAPQPKKPAAAKKSPAAVDAPKLKHWGDLCALCYKTWGLSRDDVLKHLGVETFQDLTDTPDEVFSALRAGMQK